MKFIMKYSVSVVLLALFLSILMQFFVEENDAITLVARPRIRTSTVKRKPVRKISSPVPTKRPLRFKIRALKDKIRKKDKTRQRVPGMRGKFKVSVLY